MTVEQIQARIPHLSPAYKSVARIVVEQPHDVVRWTIRQLATKAAVSEPTVLRFCRALGSDGYQDFKIRLAQSIATSHAHEYIQLRSDDTTTDIATKVFDNLQSKLGSIRRNLGISTIDAAIAALDRAERVEFYGLGVSGQVATDAYHKFYRLGLRTIAYTDVEMVHMSAASVSTTTTVVLISNSGEIHALHDAAKLANKNGATTIAVTAAGSTLAGLASISILVDPVELGSIHSPLISRVAHLLVLDTLALGLTAKRR